MSLPGGPPPPPPPYVRNGLIVLIVPRIAFGVGFIVAGLLGGDLWLDFARDMSFFQNVVFGVLWGSGAVQVGVLAHDFVQRRCIQWVVKNEDEYQART